MQTILLNLNNILQKQNKQTPGTPVFTSITKCNNTKHSEKTWKNKMTNKTKRKEKHKKKKN